MTKVNFYDSIDDSMLKFAVIIAKHNGKWVFCKHRERSTWEVWLHGVQILIMQKDLRMSKHLHRL